MLLLAAFSLAWTIATPTLAAVARRGPYLQLGTPTTMVIRWRTDIQTSGRVLFGSSPTNLTHVMQNPEPAIDHEFHLSGLSPDTRYYYAIGTDTEILSGGDEPHSFLTAPPTGTAKPTRVWVLGDSGTADKYAAAVRDGYKTYAGMHTPDLWLLLGDNAYPDGTDAEYQGAVFDMYPIMLRSSVVWSTFGNHDGHASDPSLQTGAYFDIFSFPVDGAAGGVASGTEAYYSFDYGNIHFVCLESFESDRSPEGAMLMWLEQDLAATTQDWIIAFWHHPPYSKGSHDSDEEAELVEMRENALPILENYGVDLVLSGHSHSYERSFLIDGHYGTSDTLMDHMILDNGGGHGPGYSAYIKNSGGTAPNEGAVYIVAGSSGKTSAAPLDHPVMYISYEFLGSVELDIHDNALDVNFIGTDGRSMDSCTIIRGAPAAPLSR